MINRTKIDCRAGQEYREQLDRLAMAMSMANHESDVARDLSPGVPPDRVKMFVDGNLDKRVDKLTGELEFVRPAFENLDQLIVDYIRSQPMASMDSSASDALSMLQWLAQTRDITAVQQDYLTCQRARQRVEQLGRSHRVEHVHFHDLRSLTKDLLPGLEAGQDVRLLVNPLRVWARFMTAEFLDDGESPPAEVVFFAVGSEIATAVIEPWGRTLLDELASLAPCSVASWTALSEHGDRDDILEFVHSLTELGLLALG